MKTATLCVTPIVPVGDVCTWTTHGHVTIAVVVDALHNDWLDDTPEQIPLKDTGTTFEEDCHIENQSRWQVD